MSFPFTYIFVESRLLARKILAHNSLNSNRQAAMTIATRPDIKTRKPASSGISEDILSPAMRDFWTGMHFLHRYAGRSHADIEAIGRNNLRLLHNSLLVDTHYRAILAEAGRDTSQHGLPVPRKLFSSVEINAEIVTMQEDSSLCLATQANQLCLLMVLSGRATLDGIKKRPPTISLKMHRWLTRKNPRSPQILKSQDVVWEKTSSSEPQVLTAASNACVLLRVRLPLSSLSAPSDIYRQAPKPRIAAVG